MCTAVAWRANDAYFGRNLDLEYSYDEAVTVTPRRFPLTFRYESAQTVHYAMIGMAHVEQGYPLYYEATNERGLSAAGLNFPGNAVYRELRGYRENIAPFELIPWLLGQCANIDEAVERLRRINMVNSHFSASMPLTPLHWLIADAERSVVAEPMAEGVKIHENPVGALTNNPPFPQQMLNLSGYMALSAKAPENHFVPEVPLERYSLGMGAMGLPGDLSSMSRFVRASFVKTHSVSDGTANGEINQFFHILRSVEQARGCNELEDGAFEITRYSSCCNASRGIYYYTTYENSRITAVDLHHENLDGEELIVYPLTRGPQIMMLN